MEELKPCPFCGSKGVIHSRGGNYDFQESYMAYCSNDDCIMCSNEDEWQFMYDTEQEAIDAWNTRVNEHP